LSKLLAELDSRKNKHVKKIAELAGKLHTLGPSCPLELREKLNSAHQKIKRIINSHGLQTYLYSNLEKSTSYKFKNIWHAVNAKGLNTVINSLNETNKNLAHYLKLSEYGYIDENLDSIWLHRHDITNVLNSEIEKNSKLISFLRIRKNLMKSGAPICEYCGTVLKGDKGSFGQGRRPFTDTRELYCPNCSAIYKK